ncbi:hypothetical protein pEaSNUABM3_00333 [Erwinia phage pEa_SNUABM_3]|uniref:Uncharacterized protein n=1 Tax=Erwinia phage pEa_SNUABM_3 TaxID=2869552 RepID=A0AAE8BYY4_9CAUD|nr:hypothetical protein MPK68_gp333 [Erwinia phage pEa_SNUABM_3]QZE56530.1 hypothetical protein pEaSNUABM3_00333 [Erwinia phage pEa_SNUABM_3]
MDFNLGCMSDDTQIRFLDMPVLEHKQLTAEQHKQYGELMPKIRELSKHCIVSAHRVVDGKPVERVQLQMSRTTLDKINAIAKGEQ